MPLLEIELNDDVKHSGGPEQTQLSRKAWRDTARTTREGAKLAELMADLGASGCSPRRGMALEYRCGAGRMCRELGKAFDFVWGVDSETTLLSRARELSPFEDRIFFSRIALGELPKHFVGLDFVLASSGFELMSVESTRALVRKLMNALAPGGVLVIESAAWAIPPETVEQDLADIAKSCGCNIISREKLAVCATEVKQRIVFVQE